MYKNNDNVKMQLKKQTTITAQALVPPNKAAQDYDWDVIDEYDPLWPNEYEKLVKERRERRETDRSKRRNTRNDNNTPPQKLSGFAGRSDDTENYNKSPPARSSIGVAIAPPPSLQESTPIIPALLNNSNSSSYGTGSVAAKIMAKYGFKDGQGLGKQEQGIPVALQVEKTSKRGGRIIHEKEFLAPSSSPPLSSSSSSPSVSAIIQPQQFLSTSEPKEEPSITEIMKAPSKVVLLRVSYIVILRFEK